MNAMDIMSMTREEKLEEARRLYKTANADQRYVLERLFPELIEEKNEKIRNFISNELACLRATEEKGSDRYEELTKAIAWLERQGEQILADEVKPKFNVGDWVIIDMNNIAQIKAVNIGYYTIDDGRDFNMPYVDRCWSLWTIQDAKDGDILVDNFPFIFKKQERGDIYAHGGITISREFIQYPLTENGVWTCSTKIKPATKEQRITLFKAMHKAGYEWDDKKKVLKKIIPL